MKSAPCKGPPGGYQPRCCRSSAATTRGTAETQRTSCTCALDLELMRSPERGRIIVH